MANTPWESHIMAGRERILESTIANITKKFGDGAIMRLGEASHMQVEVIPTGSLSIDIALGVDKDDGRLGAFGRKRAAQRNNPAYAGT